MEREELRNLVELGKKDLKAFESEVKKLNVLPEIGSCFRLFGTVFKILDIRPFEWALNDIDLEDVGIEYDHILTYFEFKILGCNVAFLDNEDSIKVDRETDVFGFNDWDPEGVDSVAEFLLNSETQRISTEDFVDYMKKFEIIFNKRKELYELIQNF